MAERTNRPTGLAALARRHHGLIFPIAAMSLILVILIPLPTN